MRAHTRILNVGILSILVAPAAAGAALFLSAASVVSCTQPLVPTSAIAAAEMASQTATAVVADAQAAWPVVKALLPTADQALGQDVFDKVIFTANHAILVLNDAIAAAIAANNPSPSLGQLLSSLSDAVSQVVAVVKEFQGKAPPSAAKTRVATSGVDAVADMQMGADRIRAIAGK
jgi:hypothetical protein